MVGQHMFVGPFIHAPNRDQEVTIVKKGAIIVQDSKIFDVKNYYNEAELKKEYPFVQVTKLKRGQFLIPGFIDTHIHACQVPNAGLGYDKSLLDWLDNHTFRLESCYEDNEFAKQIYMRVVKWTLSQGTTTAVYFGTIHRQSCLILAKLAHEAGQRAWVGKVNMDKNTIPELCEETSTSVKETQQFIKDVIDLKSPLVRPIIMPRFAITCSSQLLEHLGSLASKYDLLVQTHMSESKNEIEEVKKTFSSSYAKVYLDANLLESKTILAHCVHLEEDEISLLRNRMVSVAHCPNSNLCLRSGQCDVRRLLYEGVNVSLGTDVAGGCSLSILDAIRCALNTSISISFSRERYRPLTYHEAFYMATMGGAIALNEKHKLGSLEPGKYFDAIIVDTTVPNSPIQELMPLNLGELFQKFIYLGDDRNIHSVYVHGNLVHQKPA